MNFSETIMNYREDILRDLDLLMKIPSVSSKDPSAASKALDFMLERGKSMGFDVKNINGIAGHIEYGQGEEIAAVLCHVDVVPAGEGWSTEPYALTEKDGRFYGRGIVDDKGSAVIALYCLKALKDNNIETARRIRLILGAAEEIGMNDMEEYFKNEPLPDMAFTPDSEYGICCHEKGILQLSVSSPRHDGTTLTELHSGSAVNAVPSRAQALIDCTENEDHQLRRFADAKPGRYDFIYTMDGLRIDAFGKAAHACVPYEGLNSASHLIRILAANFGHTVLGSLCSFIDDAIGLETNGKSLGIACSDKESGALTVNLGVVDIDESVSRALIDIRYPVTSDPSSILRRVSARAARDGLTVSELSHVLPLSLDTSAPIVGILSSAYRTVTGSDPELYSTGGGTYARTLRNAGVAFGPTFPDDPSNLHDVNESVSVSNFFLHARICQQAVYLLSV